MFKTVFSILSVAATLYAILCSIRVVLTWIPGIENGFTRFLSSICDPYLDIFSRMNIFHIGTVNFSPVLGIALLSFLSKIFSQLALRGSISIALILSLIISMLWSVFSSVLYFLLLIFIIRFIVLLAQHNSYNGSSFWQMFDNAFNPIVYRIARTFSNGRMVSYKATLLISIIALLIVNILGSLLISNLCSLIELIPF